MLAAIVRFSLRFRGVVLALAGIFLAQALFTLGRAKYDVFPEFAPPQVAIQTEAPGLSPQQVEVLVTQPIENAVNGVEGIESLRSSSIQGLSLVTVTFSPGSEIYRDRQSITERLATIAGELPQGVQAPAMTPLTSSTSIVMVLGMTSEKRSLMELRTAADWIVRQRLLAVPGVAKVAVYGGDTRQLQIQIRPDRLIKFNLSVEDVLAAARRATGVRGAGFIDTKNQRLVLRSEGQALTPEKLAETVVGYHNGASLTLGEVTNVKNAPAPPIGAATIMGKQGVVLNVSEQFGANTVEVTKQLQRAIDELSPALKGENISLRADVFRPATFIQRAVGNVRFSLVLGAILVVIVLFAFLFNWRTAAISCTAIPLSLLAATSVLQTLGFSLNTLTLGGLAIAIGEVVDDAVIDVENILRRLRENSERSDRRPMLRVVFDASLEVRSAVVYATFAVTLVFVPVLMLSGVAGRLFAPLAIAYIAAVMASLLVALTVTPALCLVLLARRDLPQSEPPLVRWLKTRYTALLALVETKARRVIVSVAALTLFGLSLLFFIGGDFIPELQEGHFIVHMKALPGTSLEESLRLGDHVTAALTKLPFVRLVAQRAGRAEQADDVAGTHSSEFEVDLKPLSGKEEEVALADIRSVLGRIPGVNYAVKTFLSERLEETISGYTASVVVNIFGNNIDVLDKKAQEVSRVLKAVRGARDVQVQSEPGAPQIAVRLRQADLQRWGFNAVDVLDAVRTAFGGETVGQIYDGNRVFDVSVILAPDARRSVAAVGALPLRSSAGNYVRLGQLATVFETSGRYVILHDGARRVQAVTCNVSGRDVNSFTVEAQKRIRALVKLPPGEYVQFSGTAAAQARSRNELMIHSLLAFAGIVLLLSIVLRSARNLLLVLVNLPFALVGGVLALFVTGGWMTLGSLIGFVTLFGITLRNSIMLITHYEHLVEHEGMTWGPDAAMRGASERLAPILMTALVTGLGLLPLAIGSGDPGREIEGPMAIIILGGLISSTALNLLILPPLAVRFGRFRPRDSEFSSV
jgi:CzcA family heavy metal efflux pump